MSHPIDPSSWDTPAINSARRVFFVSDRTGITVETLGHSLLSQFEAVRFHYTIIPFVDTEEKARAAVERINHEAQVSSQLPLVFSSLVNERLRAILVSQVTAVTIDFFEAFLGPLEEALGTASSHALGRAHGIADSAGYLHRIDAVNFALAADDGLHTDRYDQADVILVGVSRVGKTPTCLYLALQCGLFAANYPLTEEELSTDELPSALQPYQDRLFALTIEPARLIEIRHERRPNSRYSEAGQVRREIAAAERLMRQHQLPMLDTTRYSVEEIAATILYERSLTPKLP